MEELEDGNFFDDLVTNLYDDVLLKLRTLRQTTPAPSPVLAEVNSNTGTPSSQPARVATPSAVRPDHDVVDGSASSLRRRRRRHSSDSGHVISKRRRQSRQEKEEEEKENSPQEEEEEEKENSPLEEEEEEKEKAPQQEEEEEDGPFLSGLTPLCEIPPGLFTHRVDQLFERIMAQLPAASRPRPSSAAALVKSTLACAFCRQFADYPTSERGTPLMHRYVCELATVRCRACGYPDVRRLDPEAPPSSHSCGIHCPFCFLSYGQQSTLCHHIRQQHAVPYCPTCAPCEGPPARVFAHPLAARLHVLRHHARAGGELACPTCGVACYGPAALLEHYEEVAGAGRAAPVAEMAETHRVVQCVKCCCRVRGPRELLLHSSCCLPVRKCGVGSSTQRSSSTKAR